MKEIFYWHNKNNGRVVSKIDVIINCQVIHSFPNLTVSLCLKLRTLCRQYSVYVNAGPRSVSVALSIYCIERPVF